MDIERHKTDVRKEKDMSHGRSVASPDGGSFLDDLIDDFNLLKKTFFSVSRTTSYFEELK